MPLNTLLRLMRLFLQTLMGVESTKEIPVHSPRQQVFRNIVIGKMANCVSSVKRLRKQFQENQTVNAFGHNAHRSVSCYESFLNEIRSLE